MTVEDGSVYSLRQVVDLTGVSEFTLRGWESRYQAFTPIRTPSGRRLYNAEDLLRARALHDLTARGERIGPIAGLPLKKLQRLVASALPRDLRPRKRRPDVDHVISSAGSFHWRQAATKMEEAQQKFAPKEFIYEFILPLIGEVKAQVDGGGFSIAQEHILSSYIKESLYAIRPRQAQSHRSPMRLVLATPEGDFHEIGLLIAAIFASLKGIEVLYLGPNMPKAELCQTCLRFRATHLLLATTVSQAQGAKDDVYRLLHFLDRQLAPSVELWTAGPQSSALKLRSKRSYRSIANFQELEECLILRRPRLDPSV